MKQYPQFPEDWNKAENTLYREFHFNNTPDIECLIRLVKENMSDRGNEGVLRARLLGILNSYWTRANARFWTRHYHPKTWRIRLLLGRIKRWYHRTFQTKYFKNGVELCNIAHKVANRMVKEKEL